MIQIPTLGDAQDFGDVKPTTQERGMGCSNSVRGLVAGGQTPTTTSFIETVIIATQSNTARFGDLQATNINAGGNAATTSPTRAVFCGGQAPSDTNMMQHIEMASGGTATDFGDLVRAQRGGATTSSGHGGLG